MKKRVIFSPEMDVLMQDLYPTGGGEETRKQVNERFKKTFSLRQIQDHCRHIGIKARTRVQNMPRHRYKEGDTCGHWEIIEYLGRNSTDPLFSGDHQYKVKCGRCGLVHTRIQASLLTAKKKKTTGCHICSKRDGHTPNKERAEEIAGQERRIAEQHAKFHRLMPILNLEFWTESDRLRMPHL